MNKVKIDDDLQFKVLSELDRIGYSNLLKGKRPKTLEGKIVSDADMCDTLGANGILRIHKYTLKHAKPFFDKNVFPIEDMTAEKYTRKCADSSVCHLFEKTLKLKKLMFTEAGLKEASKRHQMMVDFLYQLFDELSREIQMFREVNEGTNKILRTNLHMIDKVLREKTGKIYNGEGKSETNTRHMTSRRV